MSYAAGVMHLGRAALTAMIQRCKVQLFAVINPSCLCNTTEESARMMAPAEVNLLLVVS
jgi:hypothetical protein